ncbi:MAG: efflux RND transporter periplasmic adaptor subunit, partial [Phycisphaerales bacterium JB038]
TRSLETRKGRLASDLVGVVVMEREQADPFPPGALPLLRLVAEYIGPAMWTRRLADRKVLAVSRDRFFELGEKLVGPRHTTLKLVVAAIVLVFLLMVIVPVPNRVVADGKLKAMAMRQIPAPFAALLDEVTVKPGDVVEAGQVLGKLDTLELELQRNRSLAQLEAYEKERDKARTEGKWADAEMAAQRVNEARAMLALFEDRLSRAALTAPIAGVVTQGDLDEYINAPVEPTQVLFEVMDLSNLRIIVEVDERDIHRIEVGDKGRFAPAGSPGRRVPIEVTAVVPSAEPREAKNVYRVEAILRNPEDVKYLRPGMAGTVRISDGFSNTFTILTRRVADSIRLKLWW